jgi:hypothetical protein
MHYTTAAVMLLALAGAARGQDSFDYGPPDPAIEAYARGEAERQDAVRRQVELNDWMRWRAGFPPANGVFYYPGYSPLEDPFAPGWLWSRRFDYGAASRQPVGQVQVQTGPDRWESHPVYAEAPPPDLAPRGVEGPWAPPAPDTEFGPAPAGPRDF